MSAITLGTQLDNASTVDATSHATASFAPAAANHLVLIAVTHTAATAPADITSITGACIGGVHKVSATAFGTTSKIEVWAAISTASSGAITINYGETETSAIWNVVEFTNVDLNRGINNLIGGLAYNVSLNSGTGTSAVIPFTHNFQHTSNAVVSWFSTNSAVTFTPEALYSNLVGRNVATPTVSLHGEWRVGQDNPSIVLSSSVPWVGVALELWGADASGDWSVVETFTKADGSLWGDDQAWLAQNGTPSVVSNLATSDPQDAYGVLQNDSSTSNHEARVSASEMRLSGNSIIGVRVRGHSSSDDAYEFLRVGSTTGLSSFSVVLRKTVGGVVTNLSGPTVIPRAALTTAEQLLLTVVGTTLTAYLDGVQVAAATDAALGSRNRGGMFIRSGIAQTTLADNFQFGDIGKTNLPKQLAGNAATSSSVAVGLSVVKRLTGKAGTGDAASGTKIVRVARYQARLPVSTSSNITEFATLVEGFRVVRRMLGKIPTSSKATSTLRGTTKLFAAKVSITCAGGGIFEPAVVDVRKSFSVVTLTLASSAKSPRFIRTARMVTKTLDSTSISVHLGGGITEFTTTLPIVFYTTEPHVQGGFTFFLTNVPIVSSIVAFFLPPNTIVGTFTCPANLTENPPTYGWDTQSLGYRLFRHYKSRPVGINVYIYSDDTVTQDDPDGYSTLWRESDRTSDTLVGAPHVTHVFWGGHDADTVTEYERSLLVAAGYTVTNLVTV